VVSVYTRAGGSYVVARENFGPRVAQVAAVALMVDYVVTVAVQTAAGNFVLACTIAEASGELTALFYGRTHITGLQPGRNVQLRGPVGVSNTGPVMINPAYELLH
jgi:amino acid transporter